MYASECVDIMNVSDAVDVGYIHSNDFLNGFGMDLIIQNGGLGRLKTSTRSGRNFRKVRDTYRICNIWVFFCFLPDSF